MRAAEDEEDEEDEAGEEMSRACDDCDPGTSRRRSTPRPTFTATQIPIKAPEMTKHAENGQKPLIRWVPVGERFD